MHSFRFCNGNSRPHLPARRLSVRELRGQFKSFSILPCTVRQLSGIKNTLYYSSSQSLPYWLFVINYLLFYRYRQILSRLYTVSFQKILFVTVSSSFYSSKESTVQTGSPSVYSIVRESPTSNFTISGYSVTGRSNTRFLSSSTT